MANFPVDPRPHVPAGFTLEDPLLRPPLRHEVFLIGCYSLNNEDLAIVKLQPPVHKDDLTLLAKELRKFFREIHQTPAVEIQQCALGDAYIRFTCTLDREKFLGPIFQFGTYRMSVIKHDEAENARSFDLDREAWVMLVGMPEDLRSAPLIAKAVSTFGIMVDWHDFGNLARVVVKVYLNDDAKIPNSVKVNVGLPSKGRSWTVPVFVLKKKSVPEMQDEEGFVTEGPLHPMPAQAPRWTGPTPPAPSDVTPGASNAGGGYNMQVDAAPGNVSVAVESVEDAAVDPVENAIPTSRENGHIIIPIVEKVEIQQVSTFDRFEAVPAPEFVDQSPAPVPKPKVNSIVIKEPALAPDSSATVKKSSLTRYFVFSLKYPLSVLTHVYIHVTLILTFLSQFFSKIYLLLLI